MLINVNMIFLKTGVYIAIESMTTMEKRQVLMEEDEWTVSRIDHLVVTHHKHNVAVRARRANVLSSFVNCEYKKS